MLGDHSPRIHAQQQQAIENAVMEDMEKRAAPLLMAVMLVVLAVTASTLANSALHYLELVQVNDIQPDRLEQSFHLTCGKNLLMTEQMRRIHRVQKSGIFAACKPIGEFTELMIETVAAWRVDQ